jgi:5S rRNA maturation endonuclease (ribonuclease M5)
METKTHTREEIIGSRSLRTECERAGLTFKKVGAELYAKCPFHNDQGKPNFRFSERKDTWFCDVCNTGGGVVEFVALLSGKTPKDVFKEWAVELSGDKMKDVVKKLGRVKEETTAPKGEIVATYDYLDEKGQLSYQVVRLEPKSFRQRHKNAKDEWVWNMEGVTRLLYRLPEVIANEEVWIVEGERDTETLRDLGYVGTTNTGGAGKWLEAYNEHLKGKDIILCPDNDEPGRKHSDAIIASLKDHARSIKLVSLPADYKDITNFIEYLKGEEFDNQAIRSTLDLVTEQAPVVGGFTLIPVKSLYELETEYSAFTDESYDFALNLANWLPGFSGIRPIVPGELITILGDTSVGKTGILQNIAAYSAITTLLFELELPATLMFERFLGILTGFTCEQIELAYRCGHAGTASLSKLDHVFCCNESGLTVLDLHRLITQSALKIGKPPSLVIIDYMQLVADSDAKSRYERVASTAEALKVLAKKTNTIIVSASQVGRKDYSKEGSEVIHLHDAKNAGEIENSSGLVVGAWRDADNQKILNLKVLKNTKGRSGLLVRCNFDGETMRITQRSVHYPNP